VGGTIGAVTDEAERPVATDEAVAPPTDAADTPASPEAAATPAEVPEPPDAEEPDPAAKEPEPPTDAPEPPADAPEPPAAEPEPPADAPEPPAAAADEPAPESPAEPPEAPAGTETEPEGGETAAPVPGGDTATAGIGKPIPSGATTGGLNSGDIVSGVVSAVERRELELDLGHGRVGVIGSRHWAAGLDVDLTAEAKIGDTVEAAVLVREDHKQRIVLSRSWGRQQRAWELAENARKTGEIISGVVTDAVSAGLTVDIGVRAFVPASMAGDDDLESLVGTTVECKVTEVNQLKGRCILSRKAALRTRDRQAARRRLADLSPGTMVRARVTKVEDFGALVLADGALRGRIRRSELSWFRVRRPTDVVSVGDDVEARVVSTTPAKMSLDLSLRMGDDPLKGISPGERHQATVTSLAPFGAFVSIDGGIEGLVPTAELAEHPIRHPREVVVPGDSVLAEVTKVDRQRRELEFSVNLAVLVRPPDAERA
jgi:predicted RNA-binding protein with RPS1 domain